MGGLTIGVVGPGDLVDPIADVAEDGRRNRVVRIAYQHEDDAVRLVAEHHDEVDAWLFTGVVPHTVAEAADVVGHPAEHVSYSGVTLLSDVIRLLRDGREIRALSVDTLEAAEVRETLAAAGLETTATEILEYRFGQTGQDVVAFHRRAVERLGPDTVILTCLGSAFTALRSEHPTVRMVPSQRDTREAVASLVLKTQSHRYSDAQVAVGLAEIDGDDAPLTGLFSRLGASRFQLGEGRSAFVTTRGPLWTVTHRFTRLPVLAELAEHATRVHVGIGIGRSAMAAESAARTALGKAVDAGPVAASLVLPNEAPRMLYAQEAGPALVEPAADLRQLAGRAGVSTRTLLVIRDLLERTERAEVTAHDVAEAFGIHERSARRLVKQLERAGIAVPSGRRISGPGRPLVVYELTL
ncbi:MULTISPECIES: hypothetical protein [Actinoalloteichus]|uniref:Transcriptional regulator n=1 Tax=Actinoalloteichus fjordicus TaxID=1612552 RepID=A0AAC9LFE1_9PSEU|nr:MULTISPECIES: hypothetical protein [Actinoalloteichus]APU15767.1 hypothetical protein UA74_18695 [Actinoalloteichus fjordicus]APU21827.1 hypothetical protein UA75_19185 [Actinoalloteichus sp. GBA129-24]